MSTFNEDALFKKNHHKKLLEKNKRKIKINPRLKEKFNKLFGSPSAETKSSCEITECIYTTIPKTPLVSKIIFEEDDEFENYEDHIEAKNCTHNVKDTNISKSECLLQGIMEHDYKNVSKTQEIADAIIQNDVTETEFLRNKMIITLGTPKDIMKAFTLNEAECKQSPIQKDIFTNDEESGNKTIVNQDDENKDISTFLNQNERFDNVYSQDLTENICQTETSFVGKFPFVTPKLFHNDMHNCEPINTIKETKLVDSNIKTQDKPSSSRCETVNNKIIDTFLKVKVTTNVDYIKNRILTYVGTNIKSILISLSENIIIIMQEILNFNEKWLFAKKLTHIEKFRKRAWDNFAETKQNYYTLSYATIIKYVLPNGISFHRKFFILTRKLAMEKQLIKEDIFPEDIFFAIWDNLIKESEIIKKEIETLEQNMHVSKYIPENHISNSINIITQSMNNVPTAYYNFNTNGLHQPQQHLPKPFDNKTNHYYNCGNPTFNVNTSVQQAVLQPYLSTNNSNFEHNFRTQFTSNGHKAASVNSCDQQLLTYSNSTYKNNLTQFPQPSLSASNPISKPGSFTSNTIQYVPFVNDRNQSLPTYSQATYSGPHILNKSSLPKDPSNQLIFSSNSSQYTDKVPFINKNNNPISKPCSFTSNTIQYVPFVNDRNQSLPTYSQATYSGPHILNKSSLPKDPTNLLIFSSNSSQYTDKEPFINKNYNCAYNQHQQLNPQYQINSTHNKNNYNFNIPNSTNYSTLNNAPNIHYSETTQLHKILNSPKIPPRHNVTVLPRNTYQNYSVAQCSNENSPLTNSNLNQYTDLPTSKDDIASQPPYNSLAATTSNFEDNNRTTISRDSGFLSLPDNMDDFFDLGVK